MSQLFKLLCLKVLQLFHLLLVVLNSHIDLCLLNSLVNSLDKFCFKEAYFLLLCFCDNWNFILIFLKMILDLNGLTFLGILVYLIILKLIAGFSMLFFNVFCWLFNFKIVLCFYDIGNLYMLGVIVMFTLLWIYRYCFRKSNRRFSWRSHGVLSSWLDLFMFA
jgi:hypothetical protein